MVRIWVYRFEKLKKSKKCRFELKVVPLGYKNRKGVDFQYTKTLVPLLIFNKISTLYW
jgi:hypothetical protein